MHKQEHPIAGYWVFLLIQMIFVNVVLLFRLKLAFNNL